MKDNTKAFDNLLKEIARIEKDPKEQERRRRLAEQEKGDGFLLGFILGCLFF